MGRAGRISETGDRTRTIVYLMFNSQDLGQNVRGMTDGMRNLCLATDTCLRTILKQRFVGEYAPSAQATPGFCCSVCDNSG